MSGSFSWRLGLVLAALLLPATASAQSAIAGRVSDTTGAVLPGVTVEAASPVLIERVRTAVTDSDGRYSLTDLRPGTYSVTFTLPGFSVIRRDPVQVPADVTVSVNVELQVGTVQETITVSGAAPVVDVQSVARTEVISRELMDTIPTGRDFKAVGAIIPSVKTSRQNVGGTASVIQQGLSTHGLDRVNTTGYVDGMNTNSLWSDGGVQMYQNDAMAQEISYTTSAVGAENSAGGLRVNIIPREGGNAVSGALFAGRIPGKWQSDNVTQELRDRGLRAGDRIEHIFDSNASVGFPIKRDRLWFFASARRTSLDNLVANSFHADGSQGEGLNVNINYSGRLTAQVSPRHKVIAYFDRVIKTAASELSSGDDADTAFRMRYPSMYYIGQAKWTSPLTSRLLVEAGYSSTVMAAHIGYPPGVAEVPFTPAWYKHASKQDIILGTRWNAPATDGCTCTYKYLLTSTVSYVTGSHSFKTGVQWGFGRFTSTVLRNADLIQRYRNGVPDTVQVFNSPLRANNLLKADMGLYVMDSWTLKRLTVNPGVRLEWLNGAIGETHNPLGRFVPVRDFPERPNVPDWFDVTPRFSVAYDFFGNAKTALKASMNKYMAQTQTQFAVRYNPLASSNDIRDWRDLNGDDIAQDNEIGPSNNIFFGTRPNQHPADDLRREYNVEYSVGIQHELFPRVSVTGAWYRRRFHNLLTTDNLLVDASDYAPFDVVNPLNGEIFTVYNLKRAKQGLIDLLDTNARDRDKRSQTYNGYELAMNVRFPNGASFLGGWTGDRTVSVACDGDDPNTFRFCDQRRLGLPFRHDFKLSGSYPLPMGLQFGMSLQSYAGSTAKGGTGTSPAQAGVSDGWLSVNWNVPANLFPGGRTQTVVVPLIPPGVKSLQRFTELDLSVSRMVRVGKTEVRGSLDLFNALNNNVVLAENETFGSSLGQPTEILQGRLIRVAVQVKF